MSKTDLTLSVGVVEKSLKLISKGEGSFWPKCSNKRTGSQSSLPQSITIALLVMLGS